MPLNKPRIANAVVKAVMVLALLAVIVFMWTRHSKFVRHVGAGTLLVISGLVMTRIKGMQLRYWGMLVAAAGAMLYVSYFVSPIADHATSDQSRSLLTKVAVSTVVGLGLANVLSSPTHSPRAHSLPAGYPANPSELLAKMRAYKDRSIVGFVSIISAIRALYPVWNGPARDDVGLLALQSSDAFRRDMMYMLTFFKHSRTLFRPSARKVERVLGLREVFWNDAITLNVFLMEYDRSASDDHRRVLQGYGELWMLMTGAAIDIELPENADVFVALPEKAVGASFNVSDAFESLLLEAMDKKDVRTILGDLHRTRMLTRTNYARVVSILINYTRRFPDYKYEQGHLYMMPYLLSELNEEQAFWVYCNVGFASSINDSFPYADMIVASKASEELSDVPAEILRVQYPIKFLHGQIWPHASGKLILTLRFLSDRAFWMAYVHLIRDILSRHSSDETLVRFISANRQPFEPRYNRSSDRARIIKSLATSEKDVARLFSMFQEIDVLGEDLRGQQSGDGGDFTDITFENAVADSVQPASACRSWLRSTDAAMPQFDGLEPSPHPKANQALMRWAQSASEHMCSSGRPGSQPQEWLSVWVLEHPSVHASGAQVQTLTSLSRTNDVASALLAALRRRSRRE